jgi:hypothetical protein
MKVLNTMAQRPEEFQALEDDWRKRVDLARERYLAADREGRREARAEYKRVLRIFTQLVMKGQLPPDEG